MAPMKILSNFAHVCAHYLLSDSPLISSSCLTISGTLVLVFSGEPVHLQPSCKSTKFRNSAVLRSLDLGGAQAFRVVSEVESEIPCIPSSSILSST